MLKIYNRYASICHNMDWTIRQRIEPTQDDLDAMAIEKVPPSLLIDAVHFTPDCRTIVGDMLYRKIKDLGIL